MIFQRMVLTTGMATGMGRGTLELKTLILRFLKYKYSIALERKFEDLYVNWDLCKFTFIY